jgi:hypothetical protein
MGTIHSTSSLLAGLNLLPRSAELERAERTEQWLRVPTTKVLNAVARVLEAETEVYGWKLAKPKLGTVPKKQLEASYKTQGEKLQTKLGDRRVDLTNALEDLTGNWAAHHSMLCDLVEKIAKLPPGARNEFATNFSSTSLEEMVPPGLVGNREALAAWNLAWFKARPDVGEATETRGREQALLELAPGMRCDQEERAFVTRVLGPPAITWRSMSQEYKDRLIVKANEAHLDALDQKDDEFTA